MSGLGDTGMSFGVAGLVLAAGAIVAPLGFNLAALWLALICATVAVAGERNLLFPTGAWVLSALNLLLLSPDTLHALGGQLREAEPSVLEVSSAALYLTLAAFAAPLLALLARDDAWPWARVAGESGGADDGAPAEAPTAAAEDAMPVAMSAAARQAAPALPRALSVTARVMLFILLLAGAAGVFFYLRAIDRAPGETATMHIP